MKEEESIVQLCELLSREGFSNDEIDCILYCMSVVFDNVVSEECKIEEKKIEN